MDPIQDVVDKLYRSESRQILATLIRLLGDFELAEDGLHDAFRAALEKWPAEGVPARPRAWLISTGRFKVIDRLRRSKREAPWDSSLEPAADVIGDASEPAEECIPDDRLRLIFTCCHPALAPESRAALTLREVCGLTTEEIARSYLASPSTIAQRIVRAKAKIRDARIPYQIPTPTELPDRLYAVLQVVYLVFNEGYSASSGETLTRPDLSNEAIRLGRLLLRLLPEPEVMGLLALMLLNESRRPARTSPEGDLILLDQQDRSLWNRDLMKDGISLAEEALQSRRFGPYSLQAAIAVVHAEALDIRSTDWTQIIALYDLLLQLEPSPVIALNRAVAIAMRDGPSAGLQAVDRILARGELQNYHLAHSVRADFYRRLGNVAEARAAYLQALALAEQEPERRFLDRRLNELN